LAVTWDGGAGDGLWSSPANWSSNALPTAADDVVFDGTSTQSVVIDMDVQVRSITASTAFTATIDNAPFDRNVTVGSTGVAGDGNVTLRNSAVNLGDGTWTAWGDWLHVDPATQQGPVLDSGASTVVLTGPDHLVYGKANITALFNHLTIPAGAYITSPGKLGVRGTLLIGGTLDMQGFSDTTFMRGALANVRILPGGRYTGGGGLRLEDLSSFSQQDGVIDNFSITIEDGHNNNIVPGVYAAQKIYFFARASGAKVFRPSAGTYTFTGQDFYLRTDSTASYTVDNSLNPSFVVHGNASRDPLGLNTNINWTKGTGTITLAGSGTKTIQFTDDALEDFVVNVPAGTRQLAEAVTVDSLTVTAGTFDLAGKNLAISTATPLSNNGTLRLKGSETITGLVGDSDSGSVIYDGTATATLANIGPYHDLTFAGSGTHTLPAADVTVGGTLHVDAGTVAMNGDFDLTVANGSAALQALTIAAGATLQNYGTGDLTLGGHVDNDGSVVIDGGGIGVGHADDILLRSTNSTVRDWSGSGTFVFKDVDVAKQSATSGTPAVIEALSATDSGDNVNWLFNPTGSNNAPQLDPIGPKTADGPLPLTFVVTASDPDAADALFYSLDAGAPAGAVVDPQTGLFQWTPSAAQTPGTYMVTVRVTDDGSPAMDDFETIMIEVRQAGDVDLDGDVDFQDFLTLQAYYGVTSGAMRSDGDLDGDEDVDFQDFVVLQVFYGQGADEPDALHDEPDTISPSATPSPSARSAQAVAADELWNAAAVDQYLESYTPAASDIDLVWLPGSSGNDPEALVNQIVRTKRAARTRR